MASERGPVRHEGRTCIRTVEDIEDCITFEAGTVRLSRRWRTVVRWKRRVPWHTLRPTEIPAALSGELPERVLPPTQSEGEDDGE